MLREKEGRGGGADPNLTGHIRSHKEGLLVLGEGNKGAGNTPRVPSGPEGRLEDLGVSKTVRRDLLGHEPKDITDDYTHSTIEMRRRAVARLCQAWGEDLTQNEEMSGKSLASA